MRQIWLAALLLMATAMASAQDRSGGNTASDWLVTHYKAFGLWDSICDERTEEGALKQRCYLRYVEAYSPHPKFLAVFAFVYPVDGKTSVEFGFERGTRYAGNGFRVERKGETVWQFDGNCLNATKCEFRGDDAQRLLDAFSGGDVLIQEFRDRHADVQRLSWDLSMFEAALQDYRQNAAARSLI